MSSEVLIARQPIVDRRERLSGYELLFRSGSRTRSGDEMTLSVIADACMSLGLSDVVGTYPGYVNFTRDLLFSDAIEVLPPDRFVLEVLETVECDTDLVRRCRELRKLGYRVALDDYVPEDPRAELLGEVDLVKVDLPAFKLGELRALTEELQAAGVRMLAEKVETRREFDTCRAFGFHLFQGYYFARPESLTGKRCDTGASDIMRTMQLAESSADTAELAASIKSQPLVAMKLLRLVNSAVIGVAEPVSNVSHAINYLGRRELRRWLWIMLLSGADQRGLASPQLWLAAVRGRALELVAEALLAGDPDAGDPGTAFTVGLLSVGHALLGCGLEEFVERLGLEPPFDEALLHRRGTFGRALAALEQLDDGEIDFAREFACAAGFDLAELSRLATLADVWVGQMLGGADV